MSNYDLTIRSMDGVVDSDDGYRGYKQECHKARGQHCEPREDFGFQQGGPRLDRRPSAAACADTHLIWICCRLVAKLDRLSREVAFVASLTAQRVPFIVATGNPAHLSRFVPAELWQNIVP